MNLQTKIEVVCTAPEPPKKRKLKAVRQTSLDDYKSMKPGTLRIQKQLKFIKKYLNIWTRTRPNPKFLDSVDHYYLY